jgi:pyruvate-ferredoxin/flavodoxin oxidoreductase
VINGNGAVAYVMSNVCGGVIGYPITPSTEISEMFEATLAEGGVNVWGKHPFFFSPEGEHSAQSGALGAALTGGQFISNASSSQGILYAMESHYVTVGKKTGGFVLQVAARVVSKHSLNVMAGHDDVYSLLSSGYTILFGASPQEAADLAAIAYRVSATSLIPVANAMDGFSTSHMLSEALLPEPELLCEYLGDPAGRIKAPTLAQELLFGSRGRVHQLTEYLHRVRGDLLDDQLSVLEAYLAENADRVEADNAGDLLPQTEAWVPEELRAPWRRQWRNAHERGTRQLVPALVDVNNPGLTGPVQNQPDFQAGAVDHRTHFASAVPQLVRQAMSEYSDLTGRSYSPIRTFGCDDADYVMVGLGSVTDDVEAVLPYLRSQGMKVGLVAVKLLQPFPEAEVSAALAGKKAVTVLERSDQTALTTLVTQTLFKARENAEGVRHPGIPPMASTPQLTTAIFGLGGHDLQPRHLVAAFESMVRGDGAPLLYLGSQFFEKDPSPETAEIQARLRAAYPETEPMALETGPNPRLLPEGALRIRFHSVGGYGTIATGKLLTDILAGALGLHSKSAPKYGSEKSGAPTNYYITLSPEPVKITNAELEEVEIVISPDHKVFHHTDPLKGLAVGGTFLMQTDLSPAEVWAELPKKTRRTIRDRQVKVYLVDAFRVAKKHAPQPELETRMMGIAFIGAVVGHVDRIVSAGSSEEAIFEKVHEQIVKKFGRKGEAVVEGNMAVIRDGSEATHQLDYDAPELVAIDSRPDPLPLYTSSLSASCECANSSGCAATGLFDRDYYENMIAKPFREGTIGEAPVLPGSGLFMPAGTASTKDKGLFRRTVPEFQADLCTGCLECALVCPDAAIPNSVHEIHELLLTGIDELDLPPSQREELRGQVYALSERVRAAYREDKTPRAFHEIVAAAASGLPHSTVTGGATLPRNLERLVTKLAAYPVARTRPFFDAMEKTAPGTGGLFAATIDPWKCTGCLECVDVCGPDALVARDQDGTLLGQLQERFEFMSRTPNTAARFFEGSDTPEGDIKRLFLDRDNYYATTGGHGGCRGCGEVTAIRLVMSTSHALGDKRRRGNMRELEDVLARLATKLDTLPAEAADRRQRIQDAMSTLERRLYHLESGPTGRGQSTTVIANATGCSSVYASTMPYNPYNDPWVNSLFQDTQPLAKGIFEGIAAQVVSDVRALRAALLELDDAYDPDIHDRQLQMLGWSQFTPGELSLLPTVLTISGDGATYDIGFGALSRVLASETPLKVMVLNTGVYSNTGGQASTASFTGQDSDLARVGSSQSGKHETRKELGLIASFHPNVFVCATSTALQGHFLKNTMEFLTYSGAPSVMDVYTPCGSEHGIADDASSQRARLAVESRMNPVFVHDPRRGSTLHEWFSLDGNPDPGETWATMSIEHLDADGNLQLMDTPLTPADFALGEVRFKKHFRVVDIDEDPVTVPIDAYVDLTPAERVGHVPFVWATDADKHLIKVATDGAIVTLVEERRRYWQILQFLAGVHLDKLSALHRSDVEELRARYDESQRQRESSLDEIARAMAELATSSAAQPGAVLPGLAGPPVAASPTAAAPTAAPTEASTAVVTLAEEDMVLCNDCKTCYQDLPMLFEKTKIVVDGRALDVARLIPGALEKVEITPEIRARIHRVSANCDAEIIHEH